MVLLAMGFAGPAKEVLDAFGVQRDMAGNVMAAAEGEKRFQTSVEKVFAAGDTRRGSRWLSGHCTKAGNARQRSIVF